MKNGLLICSGSGAQKNIGDYIQSVAQEQFIGPDYCYVERESLNTYKSDEKINLIMNAWFMWNPENFPPSDYINPLFISFHIVPSVAQRLLTDKTISYLKKYEPIGARDKGTMKLLQSYGIDSYFSGCLTLTLGRNFVADDKDDSIYFVDPYFELGGDYYANKLLKIYRSVILSMKHRKTVSKFYKHFNYEFKTRLYKMFPLLEKFLMAASFYESYKSSFSDDVLIKAKYITHAVNQSDFQNEEEKMEYARELIRKYARAHLIITSRIHCALPALGVETPVIFVNSEKLRGNGVRSAGRFEGLIDLMHVMEWTPKSVNAVTKEIQEQICTEGKINMKTNISVLTTYRKYAKELTEKVCKFLDGNFI